MKPMTYAYAVMDGNEPPDTYRFPASCHHTLRAAVRRRDRNNAGDPNAHYYVIEWGARRWDRERPAPEHAAGLDTD